MYGRGTFICQDCHGPKKMRDSKRCKPCNFKSKEWAEIQRESQTRKFEDPAEREKLSIARKKQYEDPTERAKIRSALSRPEVKEKMRQAQKIAQSRPEVREKHSKAMKKHFEDPEERRKTGEARHRAWMKQKKIGGDYGNQTG